MGVRKKNSSSAYCYESVIDITFGLDQIDYYKWRPLYNNRKIMALS